METLKFLNDKHMLFENANLIKTFLKLCEQEGFNQTSYNVSPSGFTETPAYDRPICASIMETIIDSVNDRSWQTGNLTSHVELGAFIDIFARDDKTS